MGLISEDLLKGRHQADPDGDAFQLLLYSLAIGLNAQLVYEIGVGQSTLALLRAVQRTGGKVISCDTNPEMMDFIVDRGKDALPQWVFHCVMSEELPNVLRGQADLIFIDGCHVESCVVAELALYWPLLKPDGLMVLHDTRSWDGPGKVLQLCAARGMEVLDLPMCQGLGVIRKRETDPETVVLS